MSMPGLEMPMSAEWHIPAMYRRMMRERADL